MFSWHPAQRLCSNTVVSLACSHSKLAAASTGAQRRSLWVLASRRDIGESRSRQRLIRYDSTAAAPAVASQTPPELDSGAPSAPMDTDPQYLAQAKKGKKTEKLEPELPEFASLKKSINYDTFKALTVRPFTHTHMTPVQAEVFPLLPQLAEPYDPATALSPDLPPRDLFVRAKTGTGKTVAFLVPVIEARLKAIELAGKKAVQESGVASDKSLEGRARKAYAREVCGALIISPTRELATQIANEAIKVSHHHDDFEVRLMVGGSSKRQQLREWMRGRRDILVATPGRLRDFLESEPEVVRGLAQTPVLVLDEADVLLELGFRDEIEAIKKFLPPTPQRQTFMFSATLTPAIRQVARSTLAANHLLIDCVKEDSSPVHAHIPQYHTVLPSAGHQIPFLLRMIAHDQLSNPGKSKIIVFFPTTKMTQLFTTVLRSMADACLPARRDTRIFEIHSKRSTEQRTSVSDMFRGDRSGASVLLTSDVSARGVDYPGVTRVIQVGIPSGADQYIHRVGRTGRAGTNGRCDLVLLPWEIGFVTWQLTDVPLRPLTVKELNTQTSELAKSFDSDPNGFFKDAPVIRKNPHTYTRNRDVSRQVSAQSFKQPLSPVLDDVENNVRDFLGNIHEDDIKETFLSLLGFYMSKTPELRIQKGIVVEGCRSWATDAMGLPAAPHVSEAFLAKLGMHDGRTKRFGNDRSSTPSFERQRAHHWEGRGRQSFKDRKVTSSWESAEERFGDTDDAALAEEYRTPRFNAKRAPWTHPGKPTAEDNFGEDSGADIPRTGGGYSRRDGDSGRSGGGYGGRREDNWRSGGGYGGTREDSGRNGGGFGGRREDRGRSGGGYGGRREDSGRSGGGYGGRREDNGWRGGGYDRRGEDCGSPRERRSSSDNRGRW